jgi:hypothetical protein
VIVWTSLAGGLVGTVVLTSGLRISQELGLTRMDIPLLIGSVFSEDRSRASIVGYALHFVNGILFSLGYAAVFAAAGHSTWWLGAALGVAHVSVVGGGLVNVVLPSIHPRMGTQWTDAEETPLLEPPGFLLHNYGRLTALITLLLHVAYGAIVGTFAGGF